MQRQEQFHDWVDRNQRHGVNVPAVACRSDGSEIEVRLRNISYEGCQMEIQDALLVGEKIRLSVRGLGEVPAEVRWVTKSRAGTRFELEIPLIAEKRRQKSFPG